MNKLTTISFLGDIAFVGNYNEYYSSGINPFSAVEPVLQSSDFVVGNLECVSEGNQGENLAKKPRLKTKTQTLNYLKILNIGLATLAHNHVYDSLFDGYVKTTDFLKESEIDFIGAGITEKKSAEPLIKVFNDISFCFLNYVTHDTNPNLPNNAEIHLNYFSLQKVKEDILKYKNEVDYVVILLHWGGRLEGGNYPDYDQPEIARKIIDYGADIIIGHHSHTLQPYEIYKNKYIFYSLGNFCFSDFISDGKLKKLDRKRRVNSIILNVDFSKKKYDIEIIPIKNVDEHIIIDKSSLKLLNQRNLLFKYIKTNYILWLIYYLKVKYYYKILRRLKNKNVNPNL